VYVVVVVKMSSTVVTVTQIPQARWKMSQKATTISPLPEIDEMGGDGSEWKKAMGMDGNDNEPK